MVDFKSYKQLFHEQFEKSQEIDDKFVEICNEKGASDAIDYLKEIGATWLDTDSYVIKYKISQWTKNSLTDEEKEDFFKELLVSHKDYVHNVSISQNTKFNLPEVNIETADGTIRAIQFSALAPSSKELLPYLETDERHGKCFDIAYYMSLHLGKPNKIVTGYIYGYSDKAKFLHSWIEATIKGEDWVIDGTLNALINKEGYYLMQHAEPITRISNETFKEDIKKYMAKIGQFPLEVYYVFRDEIIKDFENNNNIFER